MLGRTLSPRRLCALTRVMPFVMPALGAGLTGRSFAVTAFAVAALAVVSSASANSGPSAAFPTVTEHPSSGIARSYDFGTTTSHDGLALYSQYYLSPEPGTQLVPKAEKDCAAIDVPLGGLSERPRDQGSLGLCFAYTAADLVSQRIGHTVSALDAAYSYFQASGISDLKAMESSGGNTARVVVDAEPGGFCLESSLPSDAYFDTMLRDPIYRATLDPSTATYIAAGFGWEVAPLYATGAEGLMTYLGKGRQSVADGDTAAASQISSDLAKILPRLSANDFMQIFQIDRRRSNFSVVGDSFNQACSAGGRVQASLPIHSYSYYVVDPSSTQVLKASALEGFALLPVIDANLTKGRMVAITYQVDTILNGEDSIRQLGFSQGTHMHASSIVARRYDAQEHSCQYKIRNSWGAHCESYAEPYRSRCNGGYFWITESELAGVMIEASYLE